MKADGIPVVGFGAGEPDFDTPEHIKEAGIRAIREGQTKYTPTPGTVEARKAVAYRMKEDLGVDFDYDAIVISNGAKACLYATFFTLLDKEGMLQIKDGSLVSRRSMLITLCLAIGTLIGELLRIDEGFQRLGLWLKEKTGSAGGTGFVDAFVTASMTFSIGAMSIMGAIRDGLLGDYSTLAIKGVLDFVLVVVMAASMGMGCAFAAIPVLVFEGGMTLLARVLAPVLTDQAVSYLSLVGSVTIFCLGVNMVWGKKIRVANMIPAIFLAVLAAFLPWSL